jgi:hypothetical protein
LQDLRVDLLVNVDLVGSRLYMMQDMDLDTMRYCGLAQDVLRRERLRAFLGACSRTNPWLRQLIGVARLV